MTTTYRGEAGAPAEPYPDDTDQPRDIARRRDAIEATEDTRAASATATGTGTSVPPAEASGGTSTGHLVADVVTDVSTLFRQEIALAKAEVREEAKKAGKGAGMFAGAGGAGYFAALFILLAVMFGLGEVMALGWAALIVAVVLAAAAAVLALKGRSTVRSVHPAPTQTVETLREDVQWAQSRRR